MNDCDYHRLIALAGDEVEILSVHKSGKSSKLFRHQSFLAKFMFFLRREGFAVLLRKILSRRFESRLKGKEAFVICRVHGTNLYLAGEQFSIDQPIFYFLPTSLRDYEPTLDEFADIVNLNPFVGVLPDSQNKTNTLSSGIRDTFRSISLPRGKAKSGVGHDLCLVGCGDYTRTQVLPLFGGFNQKIAIDFNYEVLRSPYLQDFEIRTNDFDAIFDLGATSSIRCGVVASYHSYHTKHALGLLELANSRVFVEKPPCVTREDLALLATHYDPGRVFIGYNRRFLDWNERVRDILAKYPSPAIITMHVTEAQITPDHWYFAPNQGTRITGNLCHFVDLAIFLVAKRPCSISIAKNKRLGIDFSVFALMFEDGTAVNFVLSDLGDGTRGVQETIHIRSEDVDIIIDDYLKMRTWERGKVKRYYRRKRDKGHRAMYLNFIDSINRGIPCAYTLQDLIYSTATYQSFVDLFNSTDESTDLSFPLLQKVAH